MNKLYLINNPCLFQGEKKLKSNSNYFEGWYFKNNYTSGGISFIPSINIENGKKYCSIQVITNYGSFCIPYDIKYFTYSHEPFFIKIGNNYFSDKKIDIDISSNNITIQGTLNFSNSIKLEKKFLCPNVMGPFSYLPFMECNHAIISLNHTIQGTLLINNKMHKFHNSIGYIEKDWGTSFPSSYIWSQGNTFKTNNNASLFVSIANIPLKLMKFRGFICVFYLDGTEHRFTTYNGSKIEKFNVEKNNFELILKNKNARLHINTCCNSYFDLKAPKEGKMNTNISESINSNITVLLEKNSNVIFKDTSNNCGLEIVNY